MLALRYLEPERLTEANGPGGRAASAGRDVLGSRTKMERDAIRQILTRMVTLKNALRQRLLSGDKSLTDFRRFNLTALTAEVDRLIADATADLADLANGTYKDAARMGNDYVNEPLAASRLNIVRGTPGLDGQLVQAAFGNTVDLLTVPMQQFGTDVKVALRRVATAGDSKFEEIARLRDRIGGKGFDNAQFMAERIIRTELSRTFNQATFNRLLAMSKTFPFLRKGWRASKDNRVRLGHLQAGKQYVRGQGIPIAQPFVINVYSEVKGKAPKPMGQASLLFPVDPNTTPAGRIAAAATIMCFAPETPVAGEFIGGSVARYSGQIVELQTASGHRLTVTPNHPILTTAGWVPAGQLSHGAYVLADSGGGKGIPAFRVPDNKHRPARIDQVFQSFALAYGCRSRIVAADDFHGDGAAVNGEIDVIATNGGLDLQAESFSGERLGHGQFNFGNMCLSGGPRSCPLEHGGFSVGLAELAAGAMSSSRLFDAGSGIHTGPLEPFSFTAAPDGHTVPLKVFQQSGAADGQALAERLQRFTGIVAADQIVQIVRRQYDGHVYDLETKSGYLLAGGILAHNCRCNAFVDYSIAEYAAFTRGKLALALGKPQPPAPPPPSAAPEPTEKVNKVRVVKPKVKRPRIKAPKFRRGRRLK